ncbi:phospholipase D family protein [Novosphingobium sp.]|uniref:phospholipase D family protein n=1 Tax=Novosphingobium sp. TaxID=1874826 RepID=UPI00286E1B28|nr:phospholipase D family protein [Novosphingobium sp.]
MNQLITTGGWKKITAAASKATKPSFAAVAYFGSRGDKLLPLREGSNLVVDASLGAVTTGITDPKALRRLHDEGVKVFSMPLLHAKAFAFDSVGFVGSSNASANSATRLIEANVAVVDAKTLKGIRTFVMSLSTDCLDDDAFDWLEARYRPPKFVIPSISKETHRRLLTQIMPSDQQGYSGHQVQPTSGAWREFFGIDLDDVEMPTLRLRNTKTGEVFDRKVVRHAKVITLDIPEAVPGALLEVWYVGLNRYDYRVIGPANSKFKALDKELRKTENPSWVSGRLWIVT